MHSSSPITGFPRIAAHRWLQALFCILLCTTLAACGFRLKGTAPLPFDTLYTNISEYSAFGAMMRRAIVASSPNTRFVHDPEEAQARLMQLSNRQTRREIAIDAQGQVEDYELNLVFVFQLTDGKGRLVLPPTTLETTRELPYDPDEAQAKQDEMNKMFNDMQESMVERLVRRLSAPDVAEAFRKVRALPATDETLETILPSDTTPRKANGQDDDWNDPALQYLAPDDWDNSSLQYRAPNR